MRGRPGELPQVEKKGSHQTWLDFQGGQLIYYQCSGAMRADFRRVIDKSKSLLGTPARKR